MHFVFFKIIGDRKKKDGTYEYGAGFYSAAKKCNVYRIADEGVVHAGGEILWKNLGQPRIEKISVNRSYYYFDDYTEKDQK